MKLIEREGTMERTTDLEELKKGKPFTWGELVRIHTIGEYDIVEYHPFIFESRFGTEKIDKSKTVWHGYLFGDDLSRDSASLDDALVNCIAVKHDGYNTRADGYFMKSIR